MKKIRFICCLFALAMLMFGCAQQNDDVIRLDDMKASEIVSVLSNLGYPVGGGESYDMRGDKSQYPWNIPGCTSAAEFWIPDGTEDGKSVGYVEVFSFIEASRQRRDLEAAVSSFYPAEPYFVQVGRVYLQIPKILSIEDAAQYQAALEAMAKGELPEPYTTDSLSASSQWVGYVEIFPDFVYKGTKDATFADRHFELNDIPQNIPEELVTLHFFYTISGEYDKLYDLCGSESLQISTINTEKNFKNGQYTQAYIVRQLSTVSLEEFASRNMGILEMTKRDVTQNDLTEYTLVRADLTLTTPPEMQGQAQLSDGDYPFYYLCGKSQQDRSWKLYEVYWE